MMPCTSGTHPHFNGRYSMPNRLAKETSPYLVTTVEALRERVVCR